MHATAAVAAVGLLLAQVSGTWVSHTSGVTERLRGVSAPSASVAWASGARGAIVRTTDGGTHWSTVSPADTASLDFRDIEAISAETAYALSIGGGDKSQIYKTTDGGRTWALQFTNPDPKAFYDAIAFWDEQHGLAMGDPVDGHHTVIRTLDGGRTWTPVPPMNVPPALAGEGAFAASGTCLVVEGSANAWFATGGAEHARVFRSTDRGLTWQVSDTPIAAGNASSGVFSVAFADPLHGLAVGGDYRKEQAPGDNIARTSDGGRTWERIGSLQLRGFRSAVAYVPSSRGAKALVAGPAGTDYSTDGGTTWTALEGSGFHAVAASPDGSAAWGVGEKGAIARLSIGLLK